MGLYCENYPSAAQIADAVSGMWGISANNSSITKRERRSFSSYVPASFDNFEYNIHSIVSVLEDYPPDFIQGLNIKKIKFAESLETTNKFQTISRLSGLVDLKRKVIYAETDPDLEATIHHEIGHLIFDTMDPKLTESIYTNLEDINERFNLSYHSKPRYDHYPVPGFCNDYAASDIEEDIPETLAQLMDAPFELFDNAKWDEALGEKIELTFDLMNILTNSLMGTEWRKAKINNEKFRFFYLFS